MNDDLKSVVSRLIQDAQSQNRDSDHRMDMLDIYSGEPYGDEVAGKSSFVSTDAADAVDAILPDVLEPFTSTDRIVHFSPEGPEDEAAADQETDACHHIFWRLNNGFLILHTWFKEALIQQNAYLRSGWEEMTRVEIEDYEDLTPEEFGQLIIGKDGEDYEFLELEGVDESFQPEVVAVNPETGEPQFAPISVSLRCTKADKRYVIECLPQEEFFVTPRWSKLTFDGCPCHGARREMERGELLAMGFDEDSVEEATREYYSEEEVERRFETRDLDEYEPVEGDSSTEKVSVYEAYVRADFNEDGRAELLKVWASGDGSTILRRDGEDAIEEVSHSPFSTLTPYPMPHRHVGRSVVEQVDDIQKVKTVLMRTTLDNIYATQYPRPVVEPTLATEDTEDDLMNPAHGAPIRYNGILNTYQPQPVAGVTLPLMEKFDDLKEARVGATRYNQGLDADSLNKTATGIQQIMNASQKKTRLIARNFAETGLRDVFLRMHRDLRNGGKDMILKLRNEWVPINPRAWKERTDMSVNVGIGNGDREEKRQAYMMMQGAMQQMMMDPELRKTGAIGYPQMYALATRMAETFGIESVAEFMTPPEQLQPPQPEGPSPQEQAMQAQMQMAQMDMQMRQAKQAADIQVQQEKAALDARRLELEAQIRLAELELKREEARTKSAKAAADIQTDDEKLELARRNAIREDDFKRDKLTVDAMTGFHRADQAFVDPQPPQEADYAR